MSKSKDNFQYNSTCLYKNNVPINLDIDSICDDLYKCADNKELFDEIMKGIEKDVMTSDLEKKDFSKMNNFRPPVTNFNENKFYYKNTVPEGELITPGPYQQKIHKKYNDVNANTKFYYPSENSATADINKSQWTNRANRIVMDSQFIPSQRNTPNNNFSMLSSFEKSLPGSVMGLGNTNMRTGMGF